MMKYIAWIPARAGSKRLKDKNLRVFDGKPLIFYSINLALRCPSIDRVIVSSDSSQILDYATSLGVETVTRPADFADDSASVGEAAKHLCESLNLSSYGSALITLQPTQPLRRVNQVEQVIKEFEGNFHEYDSAFTVSVNTKKIGYIVDKSFRAINYKPEQRSQDMMKSYFENGSVYITKLEKILNEKKVFDELSLPIINEDIYGMIDIDTLDDFIIGELIFTKYKHIFYE